MAAKGGEDEPPGLMLPADLRAALKRSGRKPASCVVGLTKERQAVILLHRLKRPRKLLGEAKAAGLVLDLASLRFGRVSVSGGSDSAQAGFVVNKPVPPAVQQAMRAPMRAAGHPRFTVSADPSLEDDADDGADEDGDNANDNADLDGAGDSDAPAAGSVAPTSPVAAPAPGGAALSGGAAGAAAPAEQSNILPPLGAATGQPGGFGEAPRAGSPDAVLRVRLTPLVRRVAGAVKAGQPRAEELLAAAEAAYGALRSGDLAAAGQGADALERLLGGTAITPGTVPMPEMAAGGTAAPGTPAPGGVGQAAPSGADAFKKELTGLIQRIAPAIAADPSRREPLLKIANDANARFKAGDAAGTKAATEALRQALDVSAPSGSGMTGGPDARSADRPPPASAARSLAGASLAGAGALPVAAGATIALGEAAGTGGAGWAASPVAARIAAGAFAAAPGVALAVGTVVLVAWLAKHGKVSQVPVAGFDDLARSVPPISAEVNAATGQVILYHGPATSTPDLNSQHSVKLQAAPDGTLTDKAGQVVGRLEDKRLVPVPGLNIPGLFHGPAATRPYAEAPPGDEQPDQLGGPVAPAQGLAGAGRGGAPLEVGGIAAMTASDPDLAGATPRPDSARPLKAAATQEGYDTHPGAGRLTILDNPMPDQPTVPTHTGSPPPAVSLGNLQESFPAVRSSVPIILNQEFDPDPTKVYVDPDRYLQAAKHIRDAIAAGAPDTLTVGRKEAASRRRAATGGTARAKGKDRDEYPPAVTQEGGSGSSVRLIDPSDNRGAGSSMGGQLKPLPDGSRIRIVISSKP